MHPTVKLILEKMSNWLLHPKDTEYDVHVKRMMTPVVVSSCVLGLLAIAAGVYFGFTFLVVGGAVVQLGDILYVLPALLGISMRTVLSVVLPVVGVGVLCCDLDRSAELDVQLWALTVCVLDVTMACDLTTLPTYIIGFTVIYNTMMTAERTFRFGLFDLVNGDGPASCDCANPPCAPHFLISIACWMASIFIIVVDYYLTSSFANGMKTQFQLVNSSIEAAACVAGALAKYDVDRAEDVISKSKDDLPEELVVSYLELLSNLRSYKDYLPESLWVREDEGGARVPDKVPGVVTGENTASATVGMVFTDIQSSTALWDAYPQGMYEALQTHNTVLRKVARENDGYEVKVIGDAFMVAFCQAHDAVCFGLDAQLQLVDSAWPEDLCEHPLCRLQGDKDSPLWHGVRVRI
eukprot:Hpha_TRINITY_DN16490_c9_g1::TRINITY_DN16490_c9_g1_i1::g.159957::m.159957